MPIQLLGNSGVAVEVGGTTFRGLHTHIKPLEYGSLGHYRHSIALTMATSQGANSRLWECRNGAANFFVPTRLWISIMPAGTVTTAYRKRIELFRVTGFTAVDTTNTVTPTLSVKRTGTMAAAPGGLQVRHVTATGVAGGMTGGALTKDGNPAGGLEAWAATAAATTFPIMKEMLDDAGGTHPFVLAQNEGLELENALVGSATANVVAVLIDAALAEVAGF